MSLLNKASLIVVPSGYKEGTLYSAKPINGDGDFTFSRATNGTRVNSDGLIEKVRTNLVSYSEEFDNAYWIKGGAPVITVTANAGTAPDGTTTADRCSATSVSTSSRVYTNVTWGGGEYSLSLYVKNNGGTNTNFRFSYYDSVSQYFSPAFTLTNEWQRITFTFSPAAGAGGFWLVNTPTASGNLDLLAWGAQLETGVLTEYIHTTSSAVSVGMTDNVPRLDYSGGGCPKLLLESQRTNLVTYSEDLTNAAWTKTGVTISSNATTSPDGTTSADKIIANASGGDKFAFQLRTITLSQAFTISAFFKKSEYKLAFVRAGGQTSSPYVIYNLDTEAVVSTSGASSTKIEDYGNGWYRILLTLNSATNTTCAPNVSFIPDSGYTLSGVNIPQYTGDGTSGGFVWGCQLEANGASYGTSYIPTYGSSVTRGEDACLKTGISSLIGQSEGVVYVEYDQKLINQSITRRIFALSDGTTSNRITAYINSANGIDFYVRNSGGDLFLDQASSPIGNTQGVHKIAAAYKNGDYAVYLDGVQIISGAGTAGTIPACSRFDLGSQIGSNDLYEPMMQSLLFPTRLTNDELASLTTL
jgi:hypothetical protein